MKWLPSIALFVFILRTAGAASGNPELPENRGTNRPTWLVGQWRSDPHTLELEAGGSCSFRFFASLSGDLSQFTFGAAGRNTWSAEPRDAEGKRVWLSGIGRGYLVRRGRTDGTIYFTDPISRCEIPFYRVGKEAGAKIAQTLEQLEASARAVLAGDKQQEAVIGQTLKELREGSNACPVLTARAAFVLAHALQQSGQGKKAMLFYHYCIQLREAAFETPHVDLTRAYFFAGNCADHESGYGVALWYRARAALVQRQVLALMEAATDPPAPALKATREETATVYIECANALSRFGHTRGVVALYPAAVQLSRASGDDAQSRLAAVMLFNHLLARPDNHEHSVLLLSVSHYLETLDVREKWIRRADLPGLVLRASRLIQEMPALKPPRPDLAKRLALRAVALEKMGGVNEPRYIRNQIIPEMIKIAGISNEVVNLQLPGDDFWPDDRPVLPRADLLKQLDAIAPAVNLAKEFPELQLDAKPFPAGGGDLTALAIELEAMLPAFLRISQHPSPAQVEDGVQQHLKALK